MKKDIGVAVLMASVVTISVLCFLFCYNNCNRVRNNDTRDYKYEHYCDSIFDANPDYYIDVLVETDKYQQYVEEHREWWKYDK